MWNKPLLMTAVADLLLAAAAAALLVAATVWVVRLPTFTLTQVVVTHELAEVRRADVERAVSGLLRAISSASMSMPCASRWKRSPGCAAPKCAGAGPSTWRSASRNIGRWRSGARGDGATGQSRAKSFRR